MAIPIKATVAVTKLGVRSVAWGFRHSPEIAIGFVPYAVISTCAPDFISDDPAAAYTVAVCTGTLLAGGIYRGRI